MVFGVLLYRSLLSWIDVLTPAGRYSLPRIKEPLNKCVLTEENPPAAGRAYPNRVREAISVCFAGGAMRPERRNEAHRFERLVLGGLLLRTIALALAHP